MKNKFIFTIFRSKKVFQVFLLFFLSICLFISAPNLLYAKYTDNEKSLMAQAVNMAAQAFTDVSGKNYSKANQDLASCSGYVSALIGKNTDSKLLVELQKAIGNIGVAQNFIESKQYSNAATLTNQIWVELDAAGKAAESRNKSSTTKPTQTNSDTTSTNPATSTTGPQEGSGKANADINSGVTVKAGQSFDTILGEFDNPLEFKTVPELILRLINIGLLLAAMVSVIVIITGGFNLVTAMGNESKITKGKRSIMWAIGGLIICLMSFSIVAIIQKVIS